MRTLERWRAALVLLLVVVACTGERPPGPDVIATLGSIHLRYADFEEYLRRNGVEPDLSLESAALSALLDQFLEEEAIRQLALERGLAGLDDPGAAPLNALLRAEAAAEVSAAEVRAYYETSPERFTLPERVRLRQILTESRARADEAVAAIEAGEPFDAVARRLSEDPAAVLGGSQGVLGREDLPPALVDIVFSLAPGEVSEVVTADYGFHLFQVVEHYPPEVRPLPEVEAEIRQVLLSRHLADARERLVLEAQHRYNPRVYEGNLPFRYTPRKSSRSADDPRAG